MEQSDRQRSLKLRDRAVVLLPMALTAWIALPFARPDRWVTGFDTIAYSGPNLVVSLGEIHHGRIPQWNTEIFGGVTHIGNNQVAAFEPLMWLASPLSPHRALLSIIVAHLVILASGMWWLLRRRLTVSATAAALGTIAVIGSGLVMSRSLQFEQIAVVSWVPWVLVGVDLALDPAGSRRRLVVLPVAATLVAISGHPQQVFISIGLIGLWSVGRFLDLRPGWGGVARLAAAGALALGLASAQLLPSALALDDSAIVNQRDISDASIPVYSAQTRRLPATVIGDITQKTHSFTSGGFESMAFLGGVAAALAVIGLLTAKRPRDRWTRAAMAGAVAFGALCSLGPHTPAYRAMYRIVPGFDLARVPGRWMLLVVIGAAVLAAIGLDQLEAGLVTTRRAVVAASLLVLVVLTTWLGPFRGVSSGGLVWWAGAFAAVVAMALAARRWERVRLSGAVVLTVVAAMELGLMSDHSFARDLQGQQPFTELGDEITDFMSDQPGRSLSLTDDRFSEPAYLVPGLRPNTNAAVGVASLDGYDGGTQVTTRWVQAVSALVAGRIDPELSLRNQLALPVSPEISARLGVRWLLIDTNGRPLDQIAPDWGTAVRQRGTVVLLENPAWEAEAVIVHRSVDAPTNEPAQALESAPADAVVLEEGTTPLQCAGDCRSSSGVVHRPHPGAIDIDVPEGTAAGMVVIDEQLSEGWSATIDGQPGPIVEANGLYMGVAVPEGAQRVELRFTAPGLRAGLKVSGVSVLVIVALLIPGSFTRWVRQGRRRRGSR